MIIHLRGGLEAIISDSDWYKVSLCSWRFYNGFAVTSIGSSGTQLQRYILDIRDRDTFVTFKNRNKLDCRRENLFVAKFVTSVNPMRGKRTELPGILVTNDGFNAYYRNGIRTLYLGKYATAKDAYAAQIEIKSILTGE